MLLILAWSSTGRVRVALPGEEFSGTVTRVVDGDTLHIAGADAPIRLWGVDAPEVDDEGGDRATQALKMLALGGVAYCKEMARDRYRRIVARCLTNNGDDVSELMIESAAADEYWHYTGGYYAQRRLLKRLRGN